MSCVRIRWIPALAASRCAACKQAARRTGLPGSGWPAIAKTAGHAAMRCAACKRSRSAPMPGSWSKSARRCARPATRQPAPRRWHGRPRASPNQLLPPNARSGANGHAARPREKAARAQSEAVRLPKERPPPGGPEGAFSRSCFDSSQARQTVRWGVFLELGFAPEKRAPGAKPKAAQQVRAGSGALSSGP